MVCEYVFREGLSGHTAEEAGSWDSKQKKKWWSTRKLLDERIKKVLVSMEVRANQIRCRLFVMLLTFLLENAWVLAVFVRWRT